VGKNSWASPSLVERFTGAIQRENQRLSRYAGDERTNEPSESVGDVADKRNGFQLDVNAPFLLLEMGRRSVGIWPVFGEKCWPPKVSFVLKGRTPHHIAHLINRWKIGEDITK